MSGFSLNDPIETGWTGSREIAQNACAPSPAVRPPACAYFSKSSAMARRANPRSSDRAAPPDPPAVRCPCRSFACDRRRDAARDPDSTLPPTPALECPAKWSNAPSRSPVRPVQYRHAPTPEPRWRPTIAETAPSAPGRGSRTCSAGSRRPHIKGTTLLLKSTAFNLLRCLRPSARFHKPYAVLRESLSGCQEQQHGHETAQYSCRCPVFH